MRRFIIAERVIKWSQRWQQLRHAPPRSVAAAPYKLSGSDCDAAASVTRRTAARSNGVAQALIKQNRRRGKEKGKRVFRGVTRMHRRAQEVGAWGVKGGLKEAAGRAIASGEVGAIGELRRQRRVKCISERGVICKAHCKRRRKSCCQMGKC